MLIGISGKVGSGKDTFASLVMNGLKMPVGHTVTRKSFAYKLKHIVAYITGLDEKLMFTQVGKNIFLPEWDMTVGQIQQKLGTEGMREGVHKDAWVLSLFADYDQNQEDEHWIITDVRFQNEAIAVKNHGGYLVRMVGDPAGIRANSSRDLNHPSETDLDHWTNWDAIIVNEGTIEELEQQVKKLFTLDTR